MTDDRATLRARLFANRQVDGHSHSTACSIWGDDGTGKTAEGFAQPLPCNCGCLINWQRDRADKLAKEKEERGDVAMRVADTNLFVWGTEEATRTLRETVIELERQLVEADAAVDALRDMVAMGDGSEVAGVNEASARHASRPVSEKE